MDQRRHVWDEFQLSVGECRHWQIGPLGLWVRRTVAEWQVAHEYGSGDALVVAAAEPPPPDGIEWVRWATGEAVPPLRLVPVTPDRPVVVRPEQAFRILPGDGARIYISLPVWVRVELAREGGARTLIDLPTVELSNTWFGSLFEGELCYWLTTTARRTVDARPARPHIAAATMTIQNRSSEELPLEKVALHTANLAVYEDARGLWTSAVTVTSPSPEAPQEILVSDGMPDGATNAVRLSPPREVARGGVFARTVGLLSWLPGANQVLTG